MAGEDGSLLGEVTWLTPGSLLHVQGGAQSGGTPSVLQSLTQDALSSVMLSQPIYGERVLCTSVANSDQILFALPAKSGSVLLVQVPLRTEGQWAGRATPHTHRSVGGACCTTHPQKVSGRGVLHHTHMLSAAHLPARHWVPV